MSTPPLSPRSELRNDLTREIVETHKVLEAHRKGRAFMAKDLGYLATRAAEEPQNEDLQTRLRITSQAQSAYQQANLEAPLTRKMQNAAIDYRRIARPGEIEMLAKARFPDNAEKQAAFLKEIQPSQSASSPPNLDGLAAILNALNSSSFSFSSHRS